MKCTNATKFHRKSGGAQWRDLLFIIRSTESEWKHHPPLCHPERTRTSYFTALTGDHLCGSL
jgi:hypothetical protein